VSGESARILARISVSVSLTVSILASWNAAFNQPAPCQLSLLPPMGQEMRIGQMEVMRCGWQVKTTIIAHSTCIDIARATGKTA